MTRRPAADSYAESLSSLAVTADSWTKVTPLRVCSLAFCPLRHKHVLAAGDKRGVLGEFCVIRSLPIAVILFHRLCHTKPIFHIHCTC